MSSLAPCPFCGSDVTSIHIWSYYVECNSCGAEGPWNDADESGAIAAWNRRAPLPAEQPSNPVPLTDAEIDEYFERAGVEMQYLDHSRKWTTRGSIDMTRLRNAVKLIEARIVGQQTKGGGNG